MAAAAAARAAASVHAAATSAAAAAAAAEAAAPPPVRLGRHEAWTRFLAYEGCWQVCLSAAGEREASAAPFLAEGCSSLRAAFGFDGLLLKQVVENDNGDGNNGTAFPSLPPAGPTLAWDDSEAAALPTLGFKPEVTRTAVIKVTASRLACADLRSRALMLVGGGRNGPSSSSALGGDNEFDDLSTTSAPLTLRLRPSSWAFSDGASAPVEADGRAPRGDVLELGPEEMEDELVVEAIVPAAAAAASGNRNRNDANAAPVVVARGVVPIADVWQAAGAAASGPDYGASAAAAQHRQQQQHHQKGGGGLLFGGLFGGGRNQSNSNNANRGPAAPFPALDLASNSNANNDDGVLGKKWVTLYDATGVRYGHLALSAWICTQETTVIRAAEIRSTSSSKLQTAPSPSSTGATTTNGGRTPQTVTGWQVYDAVLSAALRAQRCSRRRLSVTGEWGWLLKKFASAYGVRDSYCQLAHARWILKTSNASSTAYCLSLLVEILGPLKAESAANRLLPAENALLAHLERDAVALLAATLESYPVLCEDAPGGVLAAGARAGGAAAGESSNNNTVPPPALAPAVELAGILRDALRPTDTQWLAERFQVAAVRRYVTLETACDAAAPMSHRNNANDSNNEDGGDAFDDDDDAFDDVLAAAAANSAGHHDPAAARAAAAAYARLEALAAALRAELVNDLKIHDAAVLPSFVTLPQLAAAEYGREFVAKLRATLARHPPPRPTRAAVDLLVAVGRHAEFLAYHNLAPPAGHAGAIEPRALFGSYVGRWVSGSRAALVARCRELEATTLATATAVMDDDSSSSSSSNTTTNVAPLVEEMLALTAAEVARYERVVAYWPAFAPALEGVACAALREAAAAASRQCGLTPVPAGTVASSNAAAAALTNNNGSSGRRIVAANRPPPSPPRWKWSAAPPVAPSNADGTRVVGGGRGYSSAREYNSNNNPCSSLMVAPHEAVLLNSLRRLLVVAPQMERLLAAWAVGRQEAAAAEAAEEAERVGGGGGGASASEASSRESSPPVTAGGSRYEGGSTLFGENNSNRSNNNNAVAVVVPRSSNSNMPPLGVQLAQLVKELRCEYAGAVTAAAARLSHAVDRIPGRSLAAALEAHGLDVVVGGGRNNDGSSSSATPLSSDEMSRALAPVLEALEEVALGAHRALDARAHAALARGLWDHAARAVLDYVEGLQEGEANALGGNNNFGSRYGDDNGDADNSNNVSASASLSNGAWRGRQAAAGVLAVVDRFFSAVLSGTLGHALQPEDLTPPASSKRAAALLADNTAAADARYTVF
jgi:hypothetical protein